MPALEALLRSSHRVAAVYTQPDRPAGRGQQLAASAVKQCALRHGLPVEQPATLREPAAVERLQNWSADVMVVAAYGLLLPQAVLHTPRLGCVNIHASLLPRWRGAAPIQRAIRRRRRAERRDHHADGRGPRHRPDAARARGADRSRERPPRACTIDSQRSARDALLEALDEIAQGTSDAAGTAGRRRDVCGQDPQGGSAIDWSRSAAEIDRQIRAFNPWPIAQTQWNGQQLRVWQADPLDSARAG